MRFLLFIVCSFIFNKATFAQSYPYEKYTTDTIYLPNFKATKVVSYQLDSVRFHVKYDDYLKEHLKLWKIYETYHKDKIGFRILDSIYNILQTQILNNDTIYLNQETFDKADFRPIMNFDKQIDSLNCEIFDENNVIQHIIIRQRGVFMKGFDDGWNGRKYFFINRKKEFFQGLDGIF